MNALLMIGTSGRRSYFIVFRLRKILIFRLPQVRPRHESGLTRGGYIEYRQSCRLTEITKEHIIAYQSRRDTREQSHVPTSVALFLEPYGAFFPELNY